MINIDNDWKEFLDLEQSKDYYKKIKDFLRAEYCSTTVYPPMKEIFNVFKFTPLNSVKVVILGQDPYHGEGQAMGLSFSVNDNIRIPPSLRNIYKEIEADTGKKCPNNGNLKRWSDQGVFLLNTALTVKEHLANSHGGIGWEVFTDNTIQCLNEHNSPKVFILWGANARSKKFIITNHRHLVLESAHPSPLSANRGFFGCKHFSKTNDFLQNNGLQQIMW